MSEGYTYDFTVTDTLDQGLALVEDSITIISNSNELTSTVTGGVIGTDSSIYFQESVTTASGGQVITLDFGTLRNTNSDNATPERITLTYWAVVLNTNDGLTDRGDSLGNSVTASWDKQDADQGTPADLDSVTVAAPDATVVEPELTVSKTVDNATPDAGDTVTFTIDIAHVVLVNNADAFDVTLDDLLPLGFTYVANSLTNTGAWAPTSIGEAGGRISVSWDTFDKTRTAQLTFQATVDQAVCPLQDLTNSVDIQWESLPEDFDSADTSDDLSKYNSLSQERTGDTNEIGGAANDFIDTDDAAVAIPDLQIAKTAVGSYTIGQDVTFTVTVTLPESTVPSLIVTDILPAGLIVDNPATDIVITPAAGFGTLNAPTITNTTTPDAAAVDSLILDFGQVVVTADPGTTNNTFDIQITARVENIIGNSDTTTLTNSVSLAYVDCSTVSHTVGPATADITLIEPEIKAVKTIADTNAIGPTGNDDANAKTADELGDVFLAKTTFTNIGTSDAYDIILTDHLAPGTKFVDITSITGPGGALTLGADYTIVVDNSPSDPNFIITINSAVALASTEQILLDYRFEVEEAWFVAGSHCNLVDANWSSMQGDVAGERIYDDTNAKNPGMSQDAVLLPVATEQDKASDCFTVPQGLGELGDFVFYDINTNGDMDIGTDIGIPDVQVSIKIDIGGTIYTAYATTGLNGEYLFTHLPATTYTVKVIEATLPGGFTPVYEGDGTGGAGTIDNSIDVAVPSPGQNLFGDFGYIGDGKIGDFIWYDENNNGLQDDAGYGINGATVQLEADLDGDGTYDYTITTTTVDSPTGDPGYYVFENLLYSDYRITVTALPGDINDYTQTADPDAALDSIGTVAPADWIADADKFIDDQDFGYIQGGSIGNYIWDDVNADKLQTGESGIGGVRVVLSGVDLNHDGIPDTLSILTAADGSYQFTGLIAGTYTITVDETTLPTGYMQSFDYQWDTTDGLNSTAVYNLATNQIFNDVDFGYTRTGSIGDTVWFDANANAAQDSGESGLSGVKVTLTGDVDLDGVVDTLTTVTDASGQYLFDDLPMGMYDINVDPATLPGGIRQTYDNDGIATSNTTNVNLGYGEDNKDIDFGYTGTGSIGDTVWFDANRNGVLDGGEAGIPNVLMTLDADFNSDGIIDFSTDDITDGSGNYLFENLPAGQYSITLDPSTLPSGLTQTYDPDSLMDGTSDLTLGAGENNLAQDFAYAVPPEPPVSPQPPNPQPSVPSQPFFPETPVIPNDDRNNDVDDFLAGPALSQRADVFQPALTTMPTMYTGHAEPGTMLHLTMYDAQGNVLATHMAPADTGGNWLANFQVAPDSEMPHKVVIQQSAAASG